MEKLSAIERPLSSSELEDLVLLSRDGVRLTFPSAFRWGPRLRRLHLTRIAIPTLLHLLYSSRNLVDLHLHEVLDPLQFSPEALANALSWMAQLQSLSLHLHSTANHPIVPRRLWPGGRRSLPVLTRLNFRGSSRYLERLVARIDAPLLEGIELTFLNENISLPDLCEFVYRIEMHKSHRRAHILFSESSISISLTQPGAPACLKLQLFCEPWRQQLLFVTRVCDLLSASLFNVEDLRISATPPSGRVYRNYSGWRDLLNFFTSTHGTPSLLHTLWIAHPGPRHAPLREAVVAFMISRRLSGHPIAVEYERLCHINELRGTETISQQIEVLSDDILLDIFRRCLGPTPQIWPTLACVCQRWRQIVFASPLGLNLRLYCTYGTPVLKNLDYWPAFPIIVKYGGFPNLDPPAPEDDDNIIAALKQSGRVSSIRLTITSSLLGKLSAISEPFSGLEKLVLLSRDTMRLPVTLPSTFRWGPRLRTLKSTKIAFPSFPQLLSHSHNLVDIHLHEIPSAGYFSPEAFANALSGMTHLRTLSFNFLSLPPRRNYLSLPPLSGERIILPALTLLQYRGTSKYLDSLVARIDAPGLGNIDITLFSQPTMDASQLDRFIQRTGIQMPLSQAKVQTSGRAISISFTSSGNSTPLRLQISCKQLDWQLSSMAQVCDQFSPFLSHVNGLRINMTQLSSAQNDVNGEQWLELLRAFDGATDFSVAGKLTTAILCALGLVEEGHTIVLPSLRHLHIENPMAMNEPSWDGLLSFIALRSRSGHPVQVNVPFKQCQICYASFREQKGLDRHLVDEHGYRILCSYCGDFECKTGYNDLFREHLRTEHSEVGYRDRRIRSSSLTPFQLDSLVTRHSSLRAPDTAPSATVTPNS
ncbi:hypothetical protein EDB83DRAFT_427717 [Lactarius deliciosus]|nr:hypothetical protein EDB83DRAFT_427717 [Lactarius deliciosus]